MSEQVRCEKADTCDFAGRDKRRGFVCGGTIPHDERDCDPCPVHPGVECIPIPEEDER